jgi:peptidoglycan/xylan/chitin deacetylase (PgdA/CDA1 family)/dienelactone hydrolase
MLKLILYIILFLPQICLAHEIAITIDDLPCQKNDSAAKEAEINKAILNALEKYKAPAIGFVNEASLYIDKDSDKRIDILKMWVERNHDLGNHTYSHKSLTNTELNAFKEEIIKGAKVSKEIMKSYKKEYVYFRHPYLDTGTTKEKRTQLEEFLKQEGYIIAPVTIDTDDWKFAQELLDNPANKDKIIARYLEHTKAKLAFYEHASKKFFGRNIKHILLLHANLLNSYAMEDLLKIMQEANYKFITLKEALTDEAYKTADNYYAPFGVSWLYRWDFTKGKQVDWSKDPEPDNNHFITTKTLKLFDQSRKRNVPVILYGSAESKGKAKAGIIKLPLAIINHGYKAKNTEYSGIANTLAGLGYLVVSIQHELDSDTPLPTPKDTESIYKRRFPIWKRNAENISFVLSELKNMALPIDFDNLILIGHSNGGDTINLFAKEHPNMVKNIIALDSLRMPLPKVNKPRILYLQANDTKADEAVLPTTEEQNMFGIKIINIPGANHIDLCDRGPEEIRTQVNEHIKEFLKTNND